MCESSLKPTIAKLENLFDLFNEHFYNSELAKPVITVSPDTRGAYGWCTGWKAWSEVGAAVECGGFYEINICAEYLARPFEEVAGTLLHEMVHLYDIQSGVKDTSRQGTYHNRYFKQAAEAHGLVVHKDEKYGWAMTDLNDEAKSFVETLADRSFELKRISPKKKKAKKSQSRKYVCPCCGVSVRATKEVHIVCGDCGEEMMESA